MGGKLPRKFQPTSGLKPVFPSFNPEEINCAVVEAEAKPVEDYAAVFGNQRPNPQSFTVPGLLSLQKSVGNQAVARLLAQRKTVQRQEVKQGASEDEGVEIKGTLPDIVEDESEGVLKGPPDPSLKSDTIIAGRSGARATGTGGQSPLSGASKKPGKIKIEIGDVNIDYKPFEKDPHSFIDKDGPSDKISVTSMPMELKQNGGKTTTPFGSEAFSPAVKDIKHTRKVRKSGNKIKVDFNLEVNVPWGVDNGGKVNVPAGDNALVTAQLQPGKDVRVFEQIESDLKPLKRLDSWVAPRAFYWSQALCERHEKFHGTDDWNWMQGPGKQVITNFLNTQDVPETNIDTKLNEAMTNAIRSLKTANTQFYKGGNTDYYAYAGEKRAFGDGKIPYEQLAEAAKNHGMTLMPAQLVAEVGGMLDAGDLTTIDWPEIQKLTNKWPTLLPGLRSNATIQNKMAGKAKEGLDFHPDQDLVDALTYLYNSPIADKPDLKAKLANSISKSVNEFIDLPFEQDDVAAIKFLTDLPMADLADIKAKAKDPVVNLITQIVGTKTKKVTKEDFETIKLLYNCAASDKAEVKAACLPLVKFFVLSGNRNKFKAIFA